MLADRNKSADERDALSFIRYSEVSIAAVGLCSDCAPVSRLFCWMLQARISLEKVVFSGALSRLWLPLGKPDLLCLVGSFTFQCSFYVEKQAGRKKKKKTLHKATSHMASIKKHKHSCLVPFYPPVSNWKVQTHMPVVSIFGWIRGTFRKSEYEHRVGNDSCLFWQRGEPHSLLVT